MFNLSRIRPLLCCCTVLVVSTVFSVTALGAPAAASVDQVASEPESAVEIENHAVPSAAEDSAEKAERESDANGGESDREKGSDDEGAHEVDGDLVAELPARSTDEFGLVGVTWKPTPGIDGVGIDVRLRTDQSWSDWEHLDVDDHDSGESTGARDGTEPLWVGEADGVAVRVISESGVKPLDLKVATIDPGDDPVDSGSTAPALYDPSNDTSTVSAVAYTYINRPQLITRSQWGASSGTPCDSPVNGKTTRGAIVHHTAGTNTYSKSESDNIVRATQSYHVKSRNWCDIGYNFLVDKYGQIFQGRKGDMLKAVRGAHAGNFDVNSETIGVSMMGEFSSAGPTSAMQASVTRIIGWRFATNYLPAKGTYTLGGLTLNRIAGHRNVVGTACPGEAGYAWVTGSGGLRDRVANYIAEYSSAIKTYVATLGSSRTGTVTVGEYASLGGRKTRLAKLDAYWHPNLGVFHVLATNRGEYQRLGSQAGPLDFPINNMAATSVSDTSMQRFQNGRIYRVVYGPGSSKSFAHYGPINAEYVKLGHVESGLGRPDGIIYTSSPGTTRANFDHGYIAHRGGSTWSAVTK